MMKKLSAISISVILLLLLFVPVVSVSAASPVYSKQFYTEDEMLTSLSEYKDKFPNVDDYLNGDLSEPQEGYHLEHKEMIIPRISDNSYSPEAYNFAESSWGSGVNYFITSYSKAGESNSIRVITYYYLNKKAVSDKLESVLNSTLDEMIYEGNCNEYQYAAYNEYDVKGEFIRCNYVIAAGEYLIEVYTADPYDEGFVGNIEFNFTGIMLPVYVQNDTEGFIDLLGDANEDGTLNIKDATLIQKHIASIITLSERGVKLADFDESGDINIKDATAIQKYIAGINVQ